MKFNLTLLGIIGLTISIALAQSIVDFSYTQYDQQQGKVSRQSSSITIKPDRELIQGFSFPQACYLARKLQQQKIQDSRDLTNYDMQSMIDGLKIDFIQLLKVSQKIKKKKGNIQELSEMSGRSNNVSIVVPRDLDLLKKLQDKLHGINDQIKLKTQQLETLVTDSVKNSNNNQFAISAVNFQIQSLRLKLDYLRNLRRNTNDADAVKAKDQYDRYFSDLKIKFDEENSLIDDLNTILKNFNQIGALRAKILNLKGKIDIADLMIEEKMTCEKEKEQIKRNQRDHEQIRILMANLRQKKKDKSNINNKYCQGVAKKLEEGIKNVLASYDYAFSCAEGLQDLKRQRDDDALELQRAQKRLKQLQDSAGIDDYKRKFEVNRQYIKNKQDELSKFSIPDYYHDINELDRLISKTESDLDDANRKKRDLGTPRGNTDVDYRKIQELVNQIKKLKGTYCQQYEKYDHKAQELWKQVHKHEAEVQYSSKIRGIYEEEINQLRDLESTFEVLRTKILKRIQ